MPPLSKYVGREYEKYNCLDLVKEFYMDNFEIEIKNYFEGEVPSREKVQCLIVSNKGEFDKVSGDPKFGDVVIINLYGYVCHIGVCIGCGKFLHSVRGAGSCIDSLARYSRMIEGFYRHQGRV